MKPKVRKGFLQARLSLMKMKDELLIGPDRWCRWHDALDVDGEPVNPRSSQAFCYCLWGAAQASSINNDTALSVIELLYINLPSEIRLKSECPLDAVTTYSDSAETFDAIPSLINQTIDRLDAELFA